jgi:CheY-like chemotaxis protein
MDAAAPFGGWRVLVVDDNAVNREILTHQLAAWQIAVEATDAADAVPELLRRAALESAGFAAIVVDHAMPCLDGVALGRRLTAEARASHAALPRLILATSSNEPGLRRSALEAGFAAVLVKPCAPSVLRAALLGTPGAARESSAATASPAVRPTESAPGAGWRVLIAEDNKVTQVVVKQMLEKLGCRVDAVANGLEAVEAVRLAPYDLVFMDVQMPEMDGLAATAAIRALHAPGRRDLWIVALTANAFHEDSQRCLAAGMNDFLAKPVRPGDLSSCLERAPAARGAGRPRRLAGTP